VKLRHPVYGPFAILQLAAVTGEDDPRKAAHLIGYADKGLRAAGWELFQPETRIRENLYDQLKRALPEPTLMRILEESMAWSESQAVACALSPSWS
jgi:hypothetical protein